MTAHILHPTRSTSATITTNHAAGVYISLLDQKMRVFASDFDQNPGVSGVSSVSSKKLL